MKLRILRYLPRFLAVSFVGLGSVLSLVATEPPVKVVLQLPYLHQFQFAGIYAAQMKGFFQAQGLEVEVRETSSQRRRAQQEVLEGRALFGVSQGPQLVLGRIEGKDLVVVAAIMQHSPQVLVTRAEENIRTPHDLIGKRVALDQTSLISEIRVMLEREGVSMDKITLVPNQWNVDELQARTADAMSVFVIDGPYELEKAGVYVNVMRPVDYGVDFYGDCLFTTGQVIREHPALVAAMRKAVLQGWDYALHHQEEMVQWILANYGEAHPAMESDGLRQEAKQVARLINADLVVLGHMNAGRWRVMGDLIHEQNANTQMARLDGFLYADPESEPSPRYLWIYPWLQWGLLVLMVVALLAVLMSWRLRRLVARRTHELQEAEHRQREIFDLAPAPITRINYAEILPHLADLRATGVTDLADYLAKNQAVTRTWCALVRVIDANRMALQISGVQTVTEMERRRLEFLTTDSIEAFPKELLAIWENRAEMRLERSVIDASGRRRDALVSWSAPLKAGRPDYSQTQLVYTDVTEVQEAGRALRASEERFRRLFEQSPLAIVEFDSSKLLPWFEQIRAAGVKDLAAYFVANPAAKADALSRLPLVDANETTLKLMGAGSKPELITRLAEVFTENTIATRCEIIANIWNGSYAMEGEIEVRRLDGQLRMMAYNWRMESENGKPAFRRSQTLLIDVTEKRVAALELQASEARYRELFENAVGGVYRSTREGRFIAVNPALVAMLGFESAQELIGDEVNQSGQTFYAKTGRRDEFLAELLRNGLVTSFESELRVKDGGTIWISENARIVRDPQGRELYYEGFVTDITKHRRLDEEMQRASKLEAVGILAGGIAHDFNNILTVVLGNITLAEMDSGVDAPGARMLNEAKRATLRARDLTQQLLTFAKGGEPVRAAVNLPELLRETTEFSLHGAKARAEFQLAANLWSVDADKGQLGQVVQNLVINSVQAMPDGGRLIITANNVIVGDPTGGLPLVPGRYVQVSVADSGTGISADHLAKIFDPYFTTKQHGSGLGLATVYSIVKKHQGHIEVESTLGRGTTFKLWLPAAAQEVVAKQAEKISGGRLHARVLFMDDEEPIRLMARAFMTRLNLECELAADGAEAVRLFQAAWAEKRPFNAVLMDLTVPGGMGGREALDLLKKIDPDVIAIVSSGYSQDPVMANYRAHGFRGILPKPYDLGQLREVLADLLAKSPVRSG